MSILKYCSPLNWPMDLAAVQSKGIVTDWQRQRVNEKEMANERAKEDREKSSSHKLRLTLL